jgi:hypothetical protein
MSGKPQYERFTLTAQTNTGDQTMRDHFKAALENITRHGDTDILPFPLEVYIFFDKFDETIAILESIHAGFEDALQTMPPDHEDVLAAVGYSGFRRATQIDPIWNVYLLSLVLAIADDIEHARLPVERQIIHSYRVNRDATAKTIFDHDRGWVSFQKRSAELAATHSHVLLCDISDFYPRV